MATNHKTFTPESLFHTSIKYIVSNMSLVESLNGIPEIIGEQLLEACVECGHLLANDEATQYSIRLFAEAYRLDFLEAFKCPNSLFMNEYCECLTVMCLHVTELDVSGCQLGNANDFLRALVSMKDLRVLNLSRNELSEDGFRLLLARYRMFKEGFQVLESCDVSKNVVSLKTLQTFLGMPKLRNICVSIASSLKLKVTRFVQEWTAIMKEYKFRIDLQNQTVATCVVTKGMGTQVVKEWERKTIEWESARLRKVEEKSQSFFSAGRVQRSASLSFKPQTNAERFETYSYVRDSSCDGFNNPGEASAVRVNQVESDTKRKWDGQVDEELPSLSKGKKKKMEHDFDIELLRMYQ